MYPPTDPQLNSSTSSPQYSVYSPNIRCGWGAHFSGSYIDYPLEINAGDTVSVSATQSSQSSSGEEKDIDIYHPGPAMGYLSLAAEEPEEEGRRFAEQRQRLNEGDGLWFKIGEIGAKDDKTWVIDGTDPEKGTIWSVGLRLFAAPSWMRHLFLDRPFLGPLYSFPSIVPYLLLASSYTLGYLEISRLPLFTSTFLPLACHLPVPASAPVS